MSYAARDEEKIGATWPSLPSFRPMKAILTSLLVAASAFAEIRTETVTVTMRDGVKLTADVYRDDAVP